MKITIVTRPCRPEKIEVINEYSFVCRMQSKKLKLAGGTERREFYLTCPYVASQLCRVLMEKGIEFMVEYSR